MPVICYLVSLYLLILPLGVIPTNRQVMMKTSVLTSIAHYRLKSVFVTLNTAESVAYKEANNFFHPIAVKLNDGYDVEDEHSFQIQIGSKIMPEYPLSSVTETLYQLGKTVGHPLHIYGRWFRSHRYIIGLDLEKISGAGFTGMSTKAGDQLTLYFKGCGAVGYSSSVPTRMYCALHCDAILNIGDAGVQLLD